MIFRSSPDDLLGTRWTFASIVAPDITVIAFNPSQRTVRVHSLDGGRFNLSLDELLENIRVGGLVEAMDAPFVHAREVKSARQPYQKTGVAGTGKRILNWTGGKWS